MQILTLPLVSVLSLVSHVGQKVCSNVTFKLLHLSFKMWIINRVYAKGWKIKKQFVSLPCSIFHFTKWGNVELSTLSNCKYRKCPHIPVKSQVLTRVASLFIVDIAIKTTEYYKQTCELYLRLSFNCEKTNDTFVLVVQGGENILIGDHYWKSHGYYLHDSDIALYKMKICKDHPIPPWNTLTWRGKVKQTETSSMKSYRDNLTTYMTTELMSNSVQYAHLGKVQNWKGVTAEDRCKFDIYCKNFLTGCVKV